MSTLYVVIPSAPETGTPGIRCYSIISKTEKTWKVNRFGGSFTVNPKTHNQRGLCTEDREEAFKHLHKLLLEERHRYTELAQACTKMMLEYPNADYLPNPVY